MLPQPHLIGGGKMLFKVACLVSCCCMLFLMATHVNMLYETKPVDYSLTTLFGGATGDGMPATSVGINAPYRLSIDSNSGNVYYTESGNYQIRYVNINDGKSHLLAGDVNYRQGSEENSLDSNRKSASEAIGQPFGVSVSSKSGHVYFSEQNLVRKVYYNATSKSFNVVTIAGGGNSLESNISSLSAKLSNVYCVVVSPFDNQVYICDNGNSKIRKIVNETLMITINGTVLGDSPVDLAFHPITGELYFATSTQVKYISNNGSVYSVLSQTSISGMTFSENGDLYFSAFNNIFKYNGSTKYEIVNSLAAPSGLAIYGNYLYVAEFAANRIRRIDLSNSMNIQIIAGVNGLTKYVGGLSGNRETMTLNIPYSTFYNSQTDQLLVSDIGRNIVLRLNSLSNYSNSLIETVIGNGTALNDVDGKLASDTALNLPSSVVQYEATGDIYVVSNNRILMISNSSQIVSVIAGNLNSSELGGNLGALNAKIGSIYSLALTDTDIYLYDSNSYRIRKVSFSTGMIESIVGNFSNVDNGDLLANQTNIDGVYDMRILNGEIIFADSNNFKIRKTSLSGKGQVTTIAGIGNFSSTVDNVKATNAYLNVPKSVAYLPNGEMIIAESNSHIIRKVNLNGTITIIAGKMLQSGFNGDVLKAKNALLYSPKGLSVLKDGRIIFSDLGNTRIRMLTPYCSDSSYTMINYTCVKNITSDTISNNDFSVLGISKYQIVKSSLVEFSLVVSKLDINQTVLSTVLNSNSYTMSYSIQSVAFSKNGTVNDFVLKNPQTNVADLFPSVILNNKFTIDYTKLTSSFNTTITIKITASNGNSLYSTFNLPFHLPPSFTNLLDLTSNSSGIAIKNNFTANLTPWSGNSDLYPLKYAIGFTTPTRDLIRITEFSESLNQEFALPYLNETIGLTVMVMDSLGNVYSNSSNNEVKNYPFDGSESEYYQLSQQLTSFNYLTCFIHDKSFKTNSNEYLKHLLNNLNVKTSDISTVIENIQQITMKSTFDEEIANQTISKLSELVQYRLETANKTKLEIGYVTSTISDDNVNSILKISSETFTTGLEIESPRKLTQKLANLIITGQIAQSVQSSNFTTYTSQNINMTVSSFVIKSTSTNQTQQIDQSQVSLSFDSAKIASQYSALSSECAISLLTYTNLFGNSQQKENETSLISSNSISITTDFKFMKDQKVLNLENLQQPIIIKFKLSSSENQEIAQSLSNSSNETLYYNLTCNYLDETSGIWRKDGCWLSGYDQTSGTIQCSCNHTTLFTTFLEQKTVVLSSQTIVQLSSMYYAQIAFGIFYLILSIVVLISLIIFRKSQPIASRLITPYLGLIALILETSLIYIVQRSVLVSQFSKSSTDWTSGDLASNWIANIVTIIVNTMQLTAILAYVMQVSRFELMKYLYNIMMEVRRRNKTSSLFSFLRALTSKKLFIGTLTIFALINIVYWTLWVILVRTGVISQKDYSFIISISYIVIILSLGSIIVLISICDWTFSSIMKLINKKSLSSTSSIKNNNNTSSSQLKLNSEENEKSNKYTDSLEKLKHEIHTMNFAKKLISLDTPLFFRMEMILFCLSFIMLVINQALGMSTLSSRYLDEVSYLKVLTNDMISFIFELIYMALHILVFGGFCLSVLLITKFRKSLRSKSENNLEDEENREMIEMISNEYGQSLFEDFCKKEFSTENLYLYQDLQQLKSKSEISQIYVKFIQSGSDMEVNIPSDCKKKLTTIYNNLQTSTQLEMQEKSTKDNLDEETNEVLQILQDNIIMNLSDSFSRFVLTSEYELYSEAFELKQNIAKQLNVL